MLTPNMAVFRSLYLAFATLLFACTLAAPIPQHNPVFGEVVSVAPANTHGGVAIEVSGLSCLTCENY